jgi:two-component system phosphate regulon response regulator PhoB
MPYPEGMTDSPKTILWVEDDTVLGSLIDQRFAAENFRIVHAVNAQDALTLVVSERPDIILLDILLPGMNGVELLKVLKSDEATKQIPVLMFSNLDDQAHVDECTTLGAAGFFVKAYVTLDTIVHQIQSVLNAWEAPKTEQK